MTSSPCSRAGMPTLLTIDLKAKRAPQSADAVLFAGYLVAAFNLALTPYAIPLGRVGASKADSRAPLAAIVHC